MSHSTLRLASVLAVLAAAPAWSQQAPPSPATPPATPPAREVPRPDQLEPGVDTSATPPSSAASGTHAGAPAAPNSSASPPAKKGGAKASPSVSSAAAKPPSADANTAAAGTGAQAANTPAPKTASGKALDRLELDTTQITGNRELPKVLYIVPWKRSDLGDLVGKPPNSLLDEVLAPVDRDVFKRENRYYDALKPDAAGAGMPAPGAPAGAASPASATGAAPGGGGKP